MKIIVITAALGAVLILPFWLSGPRRPRRVRAGIHGCTSTRRTITCRNMATATPTQTSSSLASDNRNGPPAIPDAVSADKEPLDDPFQETDRIGRHPKFCVSRCVAARSW